jgi:hypothetical protein
MAIVDAIDITPHWAPHGLTQNGNHQVLYASCESNGGELIGIDLRAKRVELCVKLGVPHRHSVMVVPLLNKDVCGEQGRGAYLSRGPDK